MSKIEDTQEASKQDDTQEETMKIGSDGASSIEKSNNSESSEKSAAKKTEEEPEKIEVKEQTEGKQEEMPSREEALKKETSNPAEEPAVVTRDGAFSETSGIDASETRKQTEPDQPRIMSAITDNEDGDRRRSSGHSDVAVGEWNSLPVLVERLREALELSLAAGCRRGDESTATSSLAETGAEVSDRYHGRRSMEQAVLGGCDHDDPKPKKDELKFLEDLLLLDIKTALTRLRETLEHTDVATLAKHGGVSDPTSKLHLLRLVSSLLSRLQVPRKEENGTLDVAASQGGPAFARKRRPIRHTIGVSAEEIAYARRQLEESSANLARLNEASIREMQREREPVPLPTLSNAPNGDGHLDEIHDKCTKDAINQRQSLRDKNKDSRGDVGVYRSSRIVYGDRPVAMESWRIDDHREKGSDDEEQNRVNKLAAVLRQRAELIDASRCNASGNKFTVKKSKIKRANTVDIPSYLKLQAGSSSYDNSGCAQLRRPINVSDKVVSNGAVTVPSFQPRTENDKKFLALINKNNETQPTYNAAPVFKSFGYTKAAEASSLANENWNSRFSNIKTAFDKPSSASDENNKLSPKPPPVKRGVPNAFQPSHQLTSRKAPADVNDAHNGTTFTSKPDMGFRHAPSSLFRKIEKISPPSSYHSYKDNAPTTGSSLREKARMFDRDDKVQPQPPSKLKQMTNENRQKASFPRPPWIETHEAKPGRTVTENGRLDYRQFCKQFAPFVGKNTSGSGNTRTQNIGTPRRPNDEHHLGAPRRKDFVPSSEKLDVVDGKITFRMFPEKDSRIQQKRRSGESLREVEMLVRDKFNLHDEKDTFEPTYDRHCNDKDLSRIVFTENVMMDATLRNGAIQTNERNDDDHPKEVHAFRLTSAAPKEKPSTTTYNNAYNIQSHGVPVQSLTNHMEYKEQKWTAPSDVDSAMSSSNHRLVENPRCFALDHNQNYHTTTTNQHSPKNEEHITEIARNARDFAKERSLPSTAENTSFQETFGYHHSPEQREQILPMNSTCESYLLPKSLADNQSPPNYSPYVKTELEKEELLLTNDGNLPEEQNIQNQDISADAGVVTRYTCAIATVASADVPDTVGQELTISSSSSSPSHFAWSYSKPSTGGSEITTTEDEIRRHNMLQQSLVRRLQNERAMLSEHPPPVTRQAVPHQAVLHQPNNFNRCSKFQTTDAPRKTELPVPVVMTGSLSTSPPAGFGAINRVTTLKGHYEQPGSQSRPIQKERSPIPNGTMDSSDKYLLSCSNKSSRSIVLSKSESWHQLALSNNHQLPSRPSQSGLSPPSSSSLAPSSYLPKPPKPKSPSPFRMKKQYEASSDSVKKMEDKIRRYFDNNQSNDSAEQKGRRFSSRDSAPKGLIGLSRSRTMPGICDEKLRLMVPVAAPQIPTASLNSAEVDKVFDDIFEEATRADDHRF